MVRSFIFHGSKKKNLSSLIPRESEKGEKFVYAVSEESFAAIFINRPGGSLVASWGRLKGIPYFCERKKGVIDKNYKKKKGSIYVVDKNLFHKEKDLWKEEWVSKKKVSVLDEIKIFDLKKYLEELEKSGKFKLIYYKDRLKYFPNIDKDLFKTCIGLINKYGEKKILPNIKKYQPSILDKVLSKIHESHKLPR